MCTNTGGISAESSGALSAFGCGPPVMLRAPRAASAREEAETVTWPVAARRAEQTRLSSGFSPEPRFALLLPQDPFTQGLVPGFQLC